MPNINQSATHHILMSLWITWTIAIGAFIAVLLMDFFVPKSWLPLPVALMAYTLLVYSHKLHHGPTARCVLILRYAIQVLIWTAIIMEVINLLHMRALFGHIIDWSTANSEIPYVSSLVLSPVMVVCAVWKLLVGNKSRFCQECTGRTGIGHGQNVVSTIYENEARYQLQLVLLGASAIAAIQWWYYFAYYININLNRPDRFFFNIIPIVIFVVMIIFMLMRYTNMAHMIGPLLASDGRAASVARFLVISGDCVLLEHSDRSNRWDTPVSLDVDKQQFISDDDARRLFGRVSDLAEFKLRYLYANKSADNLSEIIHFAVFLTEESAAAGTKGSLQGEWITIDMLDRMMKTSAVTAELANEIYRIYTITMAWKTYTRDGRRRYPIKHYRPSFRLRDFKDWDVDYSDLSWFDVASNNEDRPFFRTRRLWHKLTRRTT